MSFFNTSDLAAKINSGKAVQLSLHYPKESTMKSLNSLFAKILAKVDLVYLLDVVIIIMREIVINAVKANAKRVYFTKLNLDINDKDNYIKGIMHFKRDIIGEMEKIEPDLRSSKYKVEIKLKKDAEGILVTITNNVPILEAEMARIRIRMSKALEYNDFTDAYDNIYDDTEGAGLGIVLIALLLKNSGIEQNAYDISCTGDITTCSLRIPFEPRSTELTTKIKEEILEKVNGIPTFPEHIVILQNLCNDPNASIGIISEKIMLDPALASDVLKLSNSAGFITSKRIGTINEAVMTVGLKNVRAILIATSARRILDTRFNRFGQIWKHCNQVAFYARYIAMKFKLGKIQEVVYLSGLLHDIGKIVLLSTDLQLTNWVADIVKNRKIRTSTVMEEVSIGISHPAIGVLVAEKWRFPEYLIETIKHHHSPLNAEQKFRDMVFTVYLANMLCGLEVKKYTQYYIEEEVLARFNLTNESKLQSLHEEMKFKFNEQSKLQ